MKYIMSILKKVSALVGFKRNRCAKFAEALSQGLISRNGEADFMQFKERIVECAPDFFAAYEDANKKNDYAQLASAVDALLAKSLNRNIVDCDFPASRSGGIFENSFSSSKMLCSLALFCSTKAPASSFMAKLVEVKENDYLYRASLAKLLLLEGKYREAADEALRASALKSYDYCLDRIVNDTQKALLNNDYKPDLHVSQVDYSNLFCDMPFLNLRLGNSPKDKSKLIPSSICLCGVWLPIALEDDPSWNSEDYKEIRRSILDGSYKYCNEALCVHLRDGTLPKKDEISDPYLRSIIDNNLLELPKGPTRLMLSYDFGCNLACPSCRPTVCNNDVETTDILDEAADKQIFPLLNEAKELAISQSGEALASKHSMRILKSITPEKYPDLKVELYTNMALFSRSKWNELGNSAKSIKKLFISIDGATKETLEKLRYGLKWERLLDALKFARELRINGDIENIFLSFLLQRDNYLEMPALLKMASEHCIDEIMISPLVSHGSYTQQEFQDVNICDPKNPLFEAAQKAVGELKQRHEAMLADRVNIESSGKSVPHIMWRVESMFKA